MLRIVALGACALPAASGSGFRSQDVWTQEELERTAAEISKDVERIRGKRFLRPVALKIADKETFIAHAKERMHEMMTPEQIAGNELMAKMLGLIPADLDLMKKTFDVLEDQVGGYYVPEEDTFYIMDTYVGPLAKIILAHELTHALDDQHYVIDDDMKKLAAESDAGTAYAAVVEGSGTLAMNRYAMENLDELRGLDADAMKEMQSMGMDSMRDAPAFIWLPLMSAYLRGSAFLIRSESVMESQLRDTTPEDLERAFTEPPRSTEQILHPNKYWNPEERDEPREISFDRTGLPEGWELICEDTLGELLIAIVCTPVSQRSGFDVDNPMAALGIRYTNPVAEGWGGDRLVILGKDDGRILRLVTLWDTERDAAEFYGALSLFQPEIEASLRNIQVGADAGGSRERVEASIEYGARPDEVVLTLSVGVRSSRLRAVRDALVHEEVGSSGR